MLARLCLTSLLAMLGLVGFATSLVAQSPSQPWLYAKAHAVPRVLTNQGSGYFALVEGKNGLLYIGTAKYGENAYLVEFDPASGQMVTVVDCMREIGSKATGFAAQSKIHTRNNVGASGKIYFGTKQGYPEEKKGEKLTDYPGGYPMVYDPATRTTRVYPIPIPHQGIISVTPDEARGVAYISTCSDERPIESSHFLKLDLETGKYRDLGETNHVYAFIVVDALGRAYHPLRGGDILRYDPKTDKVERLKQTIDGRPVAADSHLADEQSHPIMWEVTADRKTMYAVAMSGNQLYTYDLSGKDTLLAGKSLGKLSPSAASTDCRALCIAPNGVVWAAITATFDKQRSFAHLISYKPGDAAPIDQGPLAVDNTDFTTFADRKGELYPWHNGFRRFGDGNLIPTAVLLGVCATRDAQYVLALSPLTLLETHVRSQPVKAGVEAPARKPVAGITTLYRYNTHGEHILGRLAQTESLDGRGRESSLRLASIYVDQKPKEDRSAALVADLGIFDAKAVPDALTLGQDKIAVEGVLVVAEHGEYPLSPTGAQMYPKRKFFEQIFATVDKYGRRGLPVFCDKHLADTWTDAKWIYDEAKKRDMPLMAGSSMSVAWRSPPIDMPRGARVKEIHTISYHKIDIYGFHAFDAMQALVERRAGGETGVAAVQTLSGDEVWKAAERGLYDRKLLDAALAALSTHPLPAGKRVEDLAKKPTLAIVDYRDGLRACLFSLDGAVQEWTSAWKDDKDQVTSLRWVLQEVRPYSHFAVLNNGIEQMIHSGRPTWPVERTLLTSGLVDETLQSLAAGGKRRETPHLDIRYQSDWNWSMPIDPARGRPSGAQ
ncbi:MAG: SMP-30/gluconolactonase/LRE family protein [Planctomycetia bacterium]|nr:SMP-30/gluconolactonase/LRE family protein [Planctomycetia bacterium]